MPPALVTRSAMRPTQRIRGDAAEAVRAAAFQADRQRSDRARLALGACGDVGKLLDEAQAFFDFIRRSLRRERADVLALRLWNFLQQRLELVRLAAEPEDQHAARVGMAGKRRDQLASAFEIAAELRAAELMRERVYAVDAVLAALGGQSRDALGCAADAADGAEDPDLVARADSSVRTSIAHERQRLCTHRSRAGRARSESILVHSGEERCQVVRVDVRAARYLRRRAANHLTVLVDRLASAYRPQCELVAARDGSEQLDRHAVQRDRLAGCEIA